MPTSPTTAGGVVEGRQAILHTAYVVEGWPSRSRTVYQIEDDRLTSGRGKLKHMLDAGATARDCHRLGDPRLHGLCA